MCIRDRSNASAFRRKIGHNIKSKIFNRLSGEFYVGGINESCLLYTSDAADERSSVDLGGRRIIKKNNNRQYSRWTSTSHNNRKMIEYEINKYTQIKDTTEQHKY